MTLPDSPDAITLLTTMIKVGSMVEEPERNILVLYVSEKARNVIVCLVKGLGRNSINSMNWNRTLHRTIG